jgi:hypothetical protein
MFNIFTKWALKTCLFPIDYLNDNDSPVKIVRLACYIYFYKQRGLGFLIEASDRDHPYYDYYETPKYIITIMRPWSKYHRMIGIYSKKKTNRGRHFKYV